MNCPGCREADANPLTVIRYLGCRECDARAVSTYPEFAAAMAAGSITPAYRGLLQRTFGKDWQQGHPLARKWADKMKEKAHAPD